MKQKSILLISHGHFDELCLDLIAERTEQEFGYPVILQENHRDISTYYNPARRQYDANRLLRLLAVYKSPAIIKTIALVRVDLFIPILTYLFGQAYFKGNTGIVSVYRLRNEQYGMPPDQNLLIERLQKVLIHEIGHTFGLVHCTVPVCVMRSSTYVEDIDQKDSVLCEKCRGQIQL